MPVFTQTELVSEAIGRTNAMTELAFFGHEIAAWKKSGAREEMLTGDRYYKGDHDICRRVRKVIGEDGKPVAALHLPNNRVVDNQYAKHVDQKKNYLLGKPVALESDNAP